MDAAQHVVAEAAKPWSPPAAHAAPVVPRKTDWGRALPFVGPVVLFIIWDLVVRTGFIKPILLPAPVDAIGALLSGLAGGPLLTDFAVTVWRTVQAFLIAAVVGMPLGVLPTAAWSSSSTSSAPRRRPHSSRCSSWCSACPTSTRSPSPRLVRC
jgi:hypothetical protein